MGPKLLLVAVLIEIVTSQYVPPMFTNADPTSVPACSCGELTSAIQQLILNMIRKNASRKPGFNRISGPMIEEIASSVPPCPSCSAARITPNGQAVLKPSGSPFGNAPSNVLLNTPNMLGKFGNTLLTSLGSNSVELTQTGSNTFVNLGPNGDIVRAVGPNQFLVNPGPKLNEVVTCVCSKGDPLNSLGYNPAAFKGNFAGAAVNSMISRPVAPNAGNSNNISDLMTLIRRLSDNSCMCKNNMLI